MPTIMVTFDKATYVLRTFVHISNISTVTDPILTKDFFIPKSFWPKFFLTRSFLDLKYFVHKIFWTQNFNICIFLWPNFFLLSFFDYIFLDQIIWDLSFETFGNWVFFLTQRTKINITQFFKIHYSSFLLSLIFMRLTNYINPIQLPTIFEASFWTVVDMGNKLGALNQGIC